MRHFRYERGYRMIWIDALCIDQRSTQEKNKQVAAMGRIFSTASTVMIWLGPEKDDSDSALDLIEHIGHHVEVNWSSHVLYPSDQCPDTEKHWGTLHETFPLRDGALTSVLALLLRPYFNRVWVRQEIALASFAVLTCGYRSTTWENFRKTIACFRLKGVFSDSVPPGRISEFNRAFSALYLMCRFSREGFVLKHLRPTLGDAECRDPRDKIFAVATLLEMMIKPNYSQGTEEVYTNVARKETVRRQDLSLLESCVLSSRTLRLPSWTPDWSTRLPWKEQMIAHWSACAWLSSHLSVPNDERICATGVAVRPVQKVTGRMLERSQELGPDQFDQILKVLRDFKPATGDLRALNISRRRWIKRFCSAFFGAHSDNGYFPWNPSYLDFKQYVEAIELIHSSTADFATLGWETNLDLEMILDSIYEVFDGLSSFVCDDGYVGLSYSGVQAGDFVTVLLGSKFPVLLRPIPASTLGGPPTCEVVSVAIVAGLMEGEAIYGRSLPPDWRPVRHDKGDIKGFEQIDGHPLGFHDPDRGVRLWIWLRL